MRWSFGSCELSLLWCDPRSDWLLAERTPPRSQRRPSSYYRKVVYPMLLMRLGLPTHNRRHLTGIGRTFRIAHPVCNLPFARVCNLPFARVIEHVSSHGAHASRKKSALLMT